MSVPADLEFHELLIALCNRYTNVPTGIRVQALIVAAIALTDASSSEARKGVCVTEAEFSELCRRFFRKVRGT